MLKVFYQYKISRKIAVVFIILLSMMVMGGIVGLYNALQITKVAAGLYTDFFLKQDTLASIEREMLTARQEIHLYITITDAISKQYLERSILAHDEKIKRSFLEHLKHKETSEREAEFYSSFKKAWTNYHALITDTIKISSEGNIKRAVTVLQSDGATRFKQAMDILQVLLTEEKGSAHNAYLKVGEFSQMIKWMTVGLTAFAIIFSVWLWSILTRSIVKPIEALEGSARKIADGDLKERVSIVSKDEIGDLSEEFNKMAENLEQSYSTLEKKVEERTEIIRTANEELQRKKHEMEILNEELIKANKMKSQFLANVSHELRTPLNSIMGFSELLIEKTFGELNDKQNQYVNYIHSSGNHLLHLINNILDLSKIEAGKLELHIDEFPLADALAEVLASTKPLAHKKGIDMDYKITPVSPVIKMDKPKLKQIMLNLISNAIKFNKEDGKINIDWDIVEEPRGTIIEKVFYFSIKDTGIGIKNEDIPRIFKEFEQLDPSITREYGGTGLGLALTKKLIELHNGRIWVDSEYGRGATFSFAIPQGTEEQKLVTSDMTQLSTAMLPLQGSEPLLPSIILVACESENLNELIKVYLEQHGYTVELASDGIDVLGKARVLKPFAIIIGIKLQKKDGWDVLKELKISQESSETPILIVSSSNNEELGFSLGAVDYMVKPISKDKLLYTLNKLSFMSKVKRHPFSILAIDDEPQVLELLGDILEKEGFGVLKASDGEDGVRLAIERDPDLIILDLMMPRVSGFDVVEKLKAHPAAKDIPIIIFTAKDITVEDKIKLGDNIANILKKASFTRNNLLNEIRKLEMAYPSRARMIDPLTRVFNYKYFSYLIVQEIARSKRYGLPFSLLMTDVDRFQLYNAKNGAHLGNEVLIHLAKLLENNIRKADCLVRYGGDEFLIVLPNITKDAAAAVAEKLRIRVENHLFPSTDAKGGERITISIGVAAFPSDAREADELLANLSKITKSAFQNGGNRVIIYKKEG